MTGLLYLIVFLYIINFRSVYILLLIFSFQVTKLSAQSIPCGADMLMQNYSEKDPALRSKLSSEANKHNLTTENSASGTIYVIPVVFHILHDNGIENISKSQICDAIALLNEDFRKRNHDTVNTVNSFKAIAGDAEIEFRLATIDPNGNATTGIDRIQTALTHNADDYSKLNQWPPSRYLNIWSVDSIAMINGISGIKGYAYGPQFASSYPEYDGILIRHDCIGRFGSGDLYQSVWARILTHETGHYLNLLHIWGNSFGVGTTCSGDDLVADTPPTKGSLWCSNLNLSTCGFTDNVQNYMNYSYCYTMFTHGQVARMRAALTSTLAARNSLWTVTNLSLTGTSVYQSCLTSSVLENDPGDFFVIFPNPAHGIFNIDYPEALTDVSIEVIDLFGQTIFVTQQAKQIDLSVYPKGMYLVKISSGTSLYTQKILLQ